MFANILNYISNLPKSKKYILFQVALLLIAFFYYLFFANKNISSFDEGYFLHNAERIYSGEVPYKGFFLQYGPTYFYFIVIFFKLFGVSILTGRFLSLFLCLTIVGSVFYLLYLLKIKSYKIIFLSFLALVSFGYPLINIPNIVWANVLMSILLLIFYFSYCSNKKTKYLVFIGIGLALSLSLKQNFGIAYIIFYNLVFLKEIKKFKKTIKNLLILNFTWIFLTFSWVYYFFLKDNISGLITYLNFSKNFITAYGFSYPPISNFLKPFGIFKQIPYYLPIFLFIVTAYLYKKSRDWKIILISLSSCIGFFVSIYPQSDLLHCFPFFGLILISLLLLFHKQKFSKLSILLILISILIGFYLTFFSKVYDNYYMAENTPLNLPKTKGMLLTNFDSASFKKVADFVNTHTKKNDYIFVYPYHPIFYFIFDRKNPSKDSIYFVRSWHFLNDKIIISEIKKRRVKYIIAYRAYKFESDLSKFIQKQKQVYSTGTFIIYQIDKYN